MIILTFTGLLMLAAFLAVGGLIYAIAEFKSYEKGRAAFIAQGEAIVRAETLRHSRAAQAVQAVLRG